MFEHYPKRYRKIYNLNSIPIIEKLTREKIKKDLPLPAKLKDIPDLDLQYILYTTVVMRDFLAKRQGAITKELKKRGIL